jgi:hypothetical protein
MANNRRYYSARNECLAAGGVQARLAKARRTKGAMFILTCVLAVLLAALGFLAYNGLMATGAQSHQTKALNAAALTAAYDLGRVVINDPNLGFVGLLDRAPIGGSLAAKDNFAMPVRSINTLLATARFDLIMADAINAPTMKHLVEDDYQNILKAQASLANAMSASLAKGGTKPTDAYGNVVDAFGDALSVYSANGGIVSDKSAFTLSLGWCSGLSSNLTIPQPTQYANVTAANCSGNCYSAYIDLPYDHYDFVFSAIDSQQPSLVSGANFSTSASGLPYEISDVVRAEGNETDKLLGMFDLPGSATVHGISFAIPGSPTVAPMTPGAFVLSFPDGNIPELLSVQSLFVEHALAKMLLMTAQSTGGDYPIDTNSSVNGPPTTIPSWMGTYPNLQACCQMAFYDWLRRAGYAANADSIVSMMKMPLSPLADTTSPFMNVFAFNTSGQVTNQFLQLEQHYCESSDAQPFCQPQGFIWSGPDQGFTNMIFSPTRELLYGVMLQDNVRQPGTISGGKHGGEPIVDIRLTQNPTFPDVNYTNTPNQLTGNLYHGPYTSISNFNGWGGKAGGWAYGMWYYTTCDIINGWQLINWTMGGDNTPEILVPQPVANQLGAQRPTYQSNNGLATEIAFHNVINCLGRTNGNYPAPPPYFGKQ